jgi:general stress protein CsbA
VPLLAPVNRNHIVAIVIGVVLRSAAVERCFADC